MHHYGWRWLQFVCGWLHLLDGLYQSLFVCVCVCGKCVHIICIMCVLHESPAFYRKKKISAVGYNITDGDGEASVPYQLCDNSFGETADVVRGFLCATKMLAILTNCNTGCVN